MTATKNYPAPGHVYQASFGELAFRLKFDPDGATMHFVPADALDFSKAKTVVYRALEIRTGVFLVTWTEGDGTTVTHVQDFENGVVHTNITQPDLTFLNLTGEWTRVE